MAQVAKGTPPVRLSTHPSGEDRMKRTKGALKDVMPLYKKAKSSKPPAAAVSGQGAPRDGSAEERTLCRHMLAAGYGRSIEACRP